MEQFNINPEKLNSIRFIFQDILELLEENEYDYDWAMLYDIIGEGSFGAVFHLEVKYEDLPRNLILKCEEICDEVECLFEDSEDNELRTKFIEELLNEYHF